MSHYDDSGEKLRRILDRAARDPKYAVDCINEARELAMKLSDAPYSSSRFFLPGLYLPATNLIEVSPIPDLPPAPGPGSTSAPVEIKMNVPGIVVGIMGASSPGGETARADLGYQLDIEETKSFVSNGLSTSNKFASFSGFAANAPWTATLLPVRGAGGWSVIFRNTSTTATYKPVFNLAMLQGSDILWRCFPKYRPAYQTDS